MAKTTTLNVPAHAIGTETTFQMTLPYLNWGAFARVSETADQLVLTSKDAPIDAPLKIERAIQPIKNIYSGSGIDVAYQRPYKRGISVMTSLDCSASTTDTDIPAFRVDSPFHAHVVVRVPVSGDFPASTVLQALTFMMTAMVNQLDPTDANAVGDPMRGILRPVNFT